MHKRIVVCCDGTWYSADKGKPNVPSNVARLSRILAQTGPSIDGRNVFDQVVYYQSGIGTGALNTLDTLTQGATGTGIEENIITAYHFLATNWYEGDEICLFGFSRGAYTARALACILTNMGMLRAQDLEYFRPLYHHFKANGDSISFGDPNHLQDLAGKSTGTDVAPEDIKAGLKEHPKPVTIKVLGVWDTVGSLGLPESSIKKLMGWNKGAEFYDTSLNESMYSPPGPYSSATKRTELDIENAFQALALDEHRGAFSPTLFHLTKAAAKKCNLRQCWFPGFHGDVGGGTTSGFAENNTLDDITLAWMCDQIDGLVTLKPDAAEGMISNGSSVESYAAGRSIDPFGYLYSSTLAGGSLYRTPGEYSLMINKKPTQQQVRDQTRETIHPSVQARILSAEVKYKPKAFEAQGGWGKRKVPAWRYEDGSGKSKDATWMRPKVSAQSYYWAEYPELQELRIPEHKIDVRKPNGFEARLLPSQLKQALIQRASSCNDDVAPSISTSSLCHFYTRIEGSILYANIPAHTGWIEKTIDLDNCLGSTGDTFDLEGTDWSKNSVHGTAELVSATKNNILEKDLPRRNILRTWLFETDKDGPRSSKLAEINLDLFITTRNGELYARAYSGALDLSTSFHFLDGTKLNALCLTKAGTLKPSHIDLLDHYGDRLGNDTEAGKGCILVQEPDGLKLKSQLQGQESGVKATEIANLSINFVNAQGTLVYEAHDEPFDRDRAFPELLDDDIWTGLAASSIHAITGNKASFIYWANISIVTTAIMLCGIAGGPAGGVLLSSLMSPFGTSFKHGLANPMIDEAHPPAGLDEASLGGIIVETLRNMCSESLGQHVESWMKSLDQTHLERISNKVAVEIYQKREATAGGIIERKMISNIVGELDGKLNPEWAAARQSYADIYVPAKMA